MVEFDADLTDPPGLDTSDAAGSLMDWAGYVLVAGMAFVALGIASNVIAPVFGNLLASLGLTSGEETTSGIPVQGDL